jgi:aryl-alcohol dehydrogenase-like predicted oxidoreductase
VKLGDIELSLDHLKQNLAALNIELTDAEFEALR